LSKIIRNSSDYIELLKEQIEFILQACEQYDNGKFVSAKLLATYIRNLVHNTELSTSLLVHLQKQNTMKFYNTVDAPKNAVFFLGMVIIADVLKVVNAQSTSYETIFLPAFKPKILHSKKWIDFNTWWNQKIIVSDRLTFTRAEMIKFMANQDGGAHVDEKVTEKYYKIVKATETMLYTTQKPLSEDPYQVGEPIKYLHYAVVRQIAHELILSLIKEFQIAVDYHFSNNFQQIINILNPNLPNFCFVQGKKIEYEW
jgi:hypothetical protein